MRPQRFNTHYLHESGVLMILAESYFVLVRLSDGKAKRVSYSSLEVAPAPRPAPTNLNERERTK